jgi:hypothetical protein
LIPGPSSPWRVATPTELSQSVAQTTQHQEIIDKHSSRVSYSGVFDNQAGQQHGAEVCPCAPVRL